MNKLSVVPGIKHEGKLGKMHFRIWILQSQYEIYCIIAGGVFPYLEQGIKILMIKQ